MASRVGQQLGNYRLIQLLGTGGFAEVYLGEHVHLKTQRAIKVLHTVLEDDNTEGFLREAQIVASLDHPHIVRVFDFEVENHTPFLIMDYFSQGNMRRLYPRGTQLSLPIVISYVKQLASALQYAHDKKIIHRDIKPENMLIDQQHTVAISDFGIAFMALSSSYHNTQEIAGTAAYMAPEQLQGHPQRASDQYALGIVVYEWLAGDLPFHGSFTEIASQHLFMPPPPLSEKVPTLPAEIEQVVLRALAKDPQKRFDGMQAFATALEQASQASINAGMLPQILPTPISPPAPIVTSVKPSAGAPDRIFVAGQLPPPAGNATTSRIESPYATALPLNSPRQPGQRISRRMIIASIGGIAGLGIGALTVNWAASARSGRVSAVPTPHAKRGTTPRSSYTPSTTGSGNVTGSSYTPSTTGKGTILVQYPSDGDIWVVAWSPDGKYIASSGDDPRVHVWDAKTGKDVFTYTGHAVGPGSSVAALAWSPDGSRIVSASSVNSQNGYRPDIQVWSVTTRKLITSYNGHNPSPGHSNVVGNLAWSPDGTRIVSAGVYDGTAQVWNAKTGSTIFTYRGQSPHSVWKVSWSPNGKFIASASVGGIVNGMFNSAGGGDVQVWQSNNGTHIYTYNDFPYLGDIAWSPNSRFIASTGSDQSIHMWEATSGILFNTFAGIYHLAWSPNGKYIATTEIDYTSKANSTIQIFNTSSSTYVSSLSSNTSQINAVVWSPDGTRIASGSGVGQRVVLVWQAK